MIDEENQANSRINKVIYEDIIINKNKYISKIINMNKVINIIICKTVEKK